jgi:hypothetical protein
MGSSGSSNYNSPSSAVPPGTVPFGQTANSPPSYPSFLPSNGTVATPESVTAAGAMKPQIVSPPAASGGGGGGYQQLLDFFSQMTGGGGGGMGGGMGGGGSGLPPAGDPGLRARAAQVRLNPHYQSPAAGGMGGGGGGRQFFNIPAPTPGSGGMVSPGDLAAYTAAQQQQQRQRDQLADEMNRNTIRNRYSPGGSR